jgi:hypothetical protein
MKISWNDIEQFIVYSNLTGEKSEILQKLENVYMYHEPDISRLNITLNDYQDLNEILCDTSRYELEKILKKYYIYKNKHLCLNFNTLHIWFKI